MRAKPLTPEELARIPEFVERWSRIGLATAPIDHTAAELAIARLYAAAWLAAPRIVWAPCPLTAQLGAIVYTAIRATGREAEASDRKVLAGIVERMIQFALLATSPASAHRGQRRAVEEAVATALQFATPCSGGFDAVYLIEDARRAGLDRVVASALAPVLRKQLRQVVMEPVRAGPVRLLRWLVQPALNAVQQGVRGLRTRLAACAYFGAPLWVPYA